MSFYASISDHYAEIFPFNPAQLSFVLGSFADPPASSLLDVGCGTGELSAGLAGSFMKVTGIDLDPSMLALARKASAGNMVFHEMDMLQIEKQFGPNCFDGLVCFGNTLVHLPDTDAIVAFVRQAGKVLKPGGKLLIQIIHYDRILNHGIDSLPSIETEQLRFERNYRYLRNLHRIEFKTLLLHKSTGRTIPNQIRLYPLRSSELNNILADQGFTPIGLYGGFTRSALKEEDVTLVAEAVIRNA